MIANKLTESYHAGMYRVVITKRAQRALDRLPHKHRRLIRSKVDDLAREPYTPNNNVKALKGSPYYRLRVGDWRVIYNLRDDELILLVLQIGPRGGVYR